nr:uncharacterized protein LOC133602501 [Nerophis lumbriciformis]
MARLVRLRRSSMTVPSVTQSSIQRERVAARAARCFATGGAIAYVAASPFSRVGGNTENYFMAGISGLAAYLPPYRVRLDDWCDWYGQSKEKMAAVVGRSFRMRGPTENVYTMAAGALLQLIDNYQIDPSRIRFLALGTESSTDNAAGAVVVKGIVNQALAARGRTELSRYCEVPEFKHACLGGLYGIKNAARFLACEPDNSSLAVVISSDIAEYARGSSGEATQGAGAVAVLMEKNPAIAEIDLAGCGSASDYRMVDFRKPLGRIVGETQRSNGQIRDFPVFNGKYSTTCYIDATMHAMRDMFERRGLDAADYFEKLPLAFMHRPYRRMPESGLGMSYLLALAHSNRQQQLDQLAEAAGGTGKALREELVSTPAVARLVQSQSLADEVYPLASSALKALRSQSTFAERVQSKLIVGADAMMDVGNLYTASLPAWLCAGFEAAATQDGLEAGSEALLVGYGSGDAAEAMPVRFVSGWREAACKIGFATALEGPTDLTQQQYESLHDSGVAKGLPENRRQRFALDRIGDEKAGDFIDYGIEYYRFGDSA